MYSLKDKKKIENLKKKLAFMWLIIFFLIYLIKKEHDYSDYYFSEKNELELELIDKNYEIRKLKLSLDSTTKVIEKPVVIKPLEKTKVQKEKPIEVDTSFSSKQNIEKKDTL